MEESKERPQVEQLLSEAAGAAEVLRRVPDAEKLPSVFPVLIASRVLGVGRNQTYQLIKAGEYPVRVLTINGRYRVSRYDLMAYLGAVRGAA